MRGPGQGSASWDLQEGDELNESAHPTALVATGGACDRPAEVADGEPAARAGRVDGDRHLRLDARVLVGRLDDPAEHQAFRRTNRAIDAADAHLGAIRQRVDE